MVTTGTETYRRDNIAVIPARATQASRTGPGWQLLGSGLEAERIDRYLAGIRHKMSARPWPERPVSKANKSGNDTAATRRPIAYLRSFLAVPCPFRDPVR